MNDEIQIPAPKGDDWEEIERLLKERFSVMDRLTEEQLWKFIRAAYHQGYERGVFDRQDAQQ